MVFVPTSTVVTSAERFPHDACDFVVDPKTGWTGRIGTGGAKVQVDVLASRPRLSVWSAMPVDWKDTPRLSAGWFFADVSDQVCNPDPPAVWTSSVPVLATFTVWPFKSYEPET